MGFGGPSMSPGLLRELLASTGPEVEAYFSFDPAAMGDPVSWAGPDPAPVGCDLAANLRSAGIHQQQIRDATAVRLSNPYFSRRCWDTFVPSSALQLS